MILVTGGAGFIGSHLCEYLLEMGKEVICVDDYSTGSPRNVTSFLANPSFQLWCQDVSLWPLGWRIHVDEIYNLACPASPFYYTKNRVQTFKSAVLGTMNMLELAKSVRAKMLHASTSEVYGDPTVHPQPEEYHGNVNPIGFRGCYDEGKRAAETLVFDYIREYEVKAKVVRIFNTYGPRMHPEDGRVVSNFIMQALKNEDITIFGDGNQTRSFCYVDDTVNALVIMMASRSVGPINIGNPMEISIRTLAETIIELTGSRSKLCFLSRSEDDPRRRRPNIDRAKKELGWVPIIGLQKGLLKTIKYFDKLLEEKDFG